MEPYGAAIQLKHHISPHWAQKLRHAIASPGAITFLLFGVVELGLGVLRPPLQSRDLVLYLLSLGASAAFWILLNKLRNTLRGTPCAGWLMAGFIGVFSATLLVATSLAYLNFGQFINENMVGFIWDDPRYFVDFATSLLVGWRIPVYLFTIVAITLLWRPQLPASESQAPPQKTSRINIAQWVLLCLFMGTATAAVNVGYLRFHHRIETSFLGAVPLSIIEHFTDKKRLHAAISMEVAPLEADHKPAWNILFIYNESLANESVFPELAATQPPETQGMPLLREWLEDEREHSVIFERAFTNSSVTDLSIPALFTGVTPDASVQTLHDAPLPWQWARAAGLRSVMVTAQRYTWANFDAFFFSDGPDIHLTALELDAPIANGNGVDDMVAANALVQQIEATPKTQPLLAILGTNAGHYPFQNESDLVDLPPHLSRHERSLRITDHAIAQVLDSLQRTGRLEHTIVVMTSDHGELEQVRHEPRMFSFYDEIARVPFFIRLPPPLIDAHPEWFSALKANQGALVQNTDIMPTLVDLLELDRPKQNQKIINTLSGQSLLVPISPDRVLIMLNTNDIRAWQTEGFGIYWQRDLRFVYTNIHGPHLFNVADDPEQFNDIWPQADAHTREYVLQIIESNRHLKRIYRH